MRPRGAIRQALKETFAAQGACTWRNAAELAQVGQRAAQFTVQNMVRCGELRPVGAQRVAGTTVRAALYELNDTEAAQRETVRALDSLTRGWARLR